MFGIGGLTGIPLAFNALDLYLHDTYYIIAHFHYVIAPGTIFALFAGISHWYPKATGRMMNERCDTSTSGRRWSSLMRFLPDVPPGHARCAPPLVRRRPTYQGFGRSLCHWNVFMSDAAFLLGIAQIPFIFNFCLELIR